MPSLTKFVLILVAVHQLECTAIERHPKAAKVKVQHFVTPDGDVAYTKQSSTGGVNGYHKFEKFKKKDGDRFGHGKREGMGEEKEEYYSSQDKKSPTVRKRSHSYQVMEENDQKVQKPPKGGYQAYAPMKAKFGKAELVMPVPDSAEYEFHVYHFAKPPITSNLPSSGYKSKPTPKPDPNPTPATRHTQVAEDTDPDYDDEIDENGRYMKEDSSDEDYDSGSDEKKADITFKNEYKTIADDEGGKVADSADKDYFAKQFDKYYNDDYKFVPFGESGEQHTSAKQSIKGSGEEYDEEEGGDDDDDGSESSHFTYASEADSDASSS